MGAFHSATVRVLGGIGLASFFALQPAFASPAFTLEEAIAGAIRNNPDFAADSLDCELAKIELKRAQDRYGLVLSLDSGINQSVRPTSSSLSGGTRLDEISDNLDLALKQSLVSNGEIGLTFANGLATTNSTFTTINPAYTPKLTLSYSQPLLRDAWTGALLVRKADLASQLARLTTRDKLMKLVADTSCAYWDLISVREAQALLERSLVTSRALLQANMAKEASGFLAKIDVVQARASVAATEADLLDAERQVLNSEDRLRRLILPADASAGWLEDLIPADKPDFRPKKLDFPSVRKVALERRPDYRAALLEIESRRCEADEAKSGTLPGLNLKVSSGVTQLSDRYAKAVGDLGALQNYFVSAGVSLELPVSRPSQRDAYEKSLLALAQSELRASAAERQLFNDLRKAFRNVEIGAKRMEAAQVAKDLARQQLEAEMDKLNLGLSTNFQVITYQKSLDETSLKANNSLVDGIKAEIELKRLEGTLLDGMNLSEVLK